VKKICFVLMIVFAAVQLMAQTQVDPLTQITWPRLTGSGAPAQYCPSVVTGTLTSGSALVTGVSSFAHVLRGQSVVGTGIPASTVVNNVNSYNGTIFLSAEATASGPTALSFSSLGMPYTDITNNVEYFCSTSGWITGEAGSGIGSITWAVPAWLTATPTTISASGTQTFSATTGLGQNEFLATPNGTAGAVNLRSIVAADIPTLNQPTTGQAGSVANSLTMNSGGAGAGSPVTYNGAGAVTLSYNTLGASPLAGSTSLVTLGTVTTGTWQGTAVAVAHGGTGQTTPLAAFDALSPMTTLGDLLYENSTPAAVRLPGYTTNGTAVLAQTGTGSASAAPVWANAPAISAANMTSFPTFNQNTTGTAGGLTGTPSISVDNLAAIGTVTLTGIEPGSGGPNCLQISSAGVVTQTGSICGSGSGGDTITSPNASLTIGGTSINTTLDVLKVPTTLTSANTTFYCGLFASNSTAFQAVDVATACSINASTGALSATSFTGAGTGLTGTAASLTAGSVANSLTMNSGGAGASSPATYNGAGAVTLSYNTLGAPGLAATTNTFTGTTNDFSGTTQLKHPVAAAYASLANGELGYDTTNLNWHGWLNGADKLLALMPTSGLTSGHCVEFLESTASWSLQDAGATCGAGGGSTFQVNGTGLISSSTVNFENGADTDGLTLTFANPSLGNVQLGMTGTLTVPGGGTGAGTLTGFAFGNGTSAFTAATTTQLGALANLPQYSVVVSGGTAAALTDVATSATTGALLGSGGAAANPAYDTNASVSAGTLSLGASGTLGAVKMGNATSGTITLEPATGALGSITESLPISSGDTLAGIAATQTLTNKSIAGSEINSGLVGAGFGGTGVNNTATITLGTSNHNWATLGTGIVKNTTTTGALTDAASSDVISLWTGSCSSSTYLNGAGACATPSGSGTVNSGTANQMAYYATTGAAVSGDTLATDNGTTFAYTGTGGVSSSGPVVSSPAAGTAGSVAFFGNTSVPSLASNTAVLIGPNAATFSDYGLQLSATGPSGAGVMLVGAPSSSTSQVTYGTVPNSDLTNSSITIAGTSVALGGSTSSLPSPGAIGGTTAAAITGTTITANTSLTVNGGTAQTGTQGTDTKLLTAGTISGTSVLLCTDANGGATTSSCPAGGGGANTALSNLAAVAINAGLLTGGAAIDLGSATAPFRDVFLYGLSTYGTDSIELTGSPTANRTLTLPDATDVLVGRATTDTLTNKSIAASEVNSGTLACAQMPALTGDATSSAGACATSVVKINGASVPTSTPVVGTNSSGQLVAGTTILSLSFQEGAPSSGTAITTGPIAYLNIPKACTLTSWDINVDAGTATVQTWKVATGTANPTVANTISTSGVAIATGTAIHSTTLTDFTTTTFAAHDIVAANLGTVSGADYINFQLEFTCAQ
jgi:filamentous hemagglutinin